MLNRLAAAKYWSGTIHAVFSAALIAVMCGIGALRSAPSEAFWVQTKAKVDSSGDPLPQGALARMGTIRWRHPDNVSFVAFGPGGKTILSASHDNYLRLWARATGKELHRFEVYKANQGQSGGVFVVGRAGVGGTVPSFTVTRDGKVMAANLWPGAIKLWNVETGKEIRQFNAPPGGVTSLLFTPDGKTLAGRHTDRTTYLFDVDTGKEIRRISLPQAAGNVRVFFGQSGDGAGHAFSPDGKRLASAEMEFNMQVMAYVRIVDTETGKEVRRIPTQQGGMTSLCWSPNGKILAYANVNNIHLQSADGDKEIRQINNQFVTAMIFSADSKTLIAKGQDQVVRIFDVESGKSLRELGKAAGIGNNVFFGFGGQGGSRDLALSDDGKVLLTGGGQTVRFWDMETGKELPLGGGHRGAVSSAVVTPDGKTMISHGADNVIRRWDTADGKEHGHIDIPAGATIVALSPDGRSAAIGSPAALRLVDAESGKALHQLKNHQGSIAALAFSADGKILASRGYDNIIRIHSVSLGTELKQLTLPGANATGTAAVVIRGGIASPTGQGMTIAPDGQTLAAYIGANNPYRAIGNPGGGAPVSPNTIRLWDLSTGKEIRQITVPPGHMVTNLAYSPDGRLLAAENGDDTISLWELASSRERALLGKAVTKQPNVRAMGFVAINGGGGIGVAAPPAHTLVFSPDGEILAARGPGNEVRLFDVPRAKEIGSFKGHDGAVRSVAYGPNGKTLASASADTTILLWDMNYIKREPRGTLVELKSKDVTSLWSDLVGGDAIKAARSMQTLIAAPRQAIDLLRDQLKPAAPVDIKKLERWVADLDNDNFKTRTKAASELEKLGELAIPALKKVLTSQPTLESRRRVEPLIEKLISGVLSAEQIRTVRAVEVLEKVGTTDARNVLETLVKGAPGALTTRHAQAALDRLNRSAPAEPRER